MNLRTPDFSPSRIICRMCVRFEIGLVRVGVLLEFGRAEFFIEDAPWRSSIVQEAPEHPRSARMLQLPDRLGLDLTDALPGHRELVADLFERVVAADADAE